jgi:hypothetical protein
MVRGHLGSQDTRLKLHGERQDGNGPMHGMRRDKAMSFLGYAKAAVHARGRWHLLVLKSNRAEDAALFVHIDCISIAKVAIHIS